MKTFKQYRILFEGKNFYRFFKSNKNLSKDQIKIIDNFFSNNKKAAREFESQWGFQSDVPKVVEWEAIENFMNLYKSGRKENLQNTKIPGKKGEDYWPIKLKSKQYFAVIPLNRETAEYMNSCKFGTIETGHCIGWPATNYWDTHIIDEQKVPIYIIDSNDHKWVVMILPDNKHYEVWDKFNKEDVSKINKNPIPNFDIKKELIQGKSKLYDEIREEFYYTKSLPESIIDEYKATGNELKPATVLEYLEDEFDYIDDYFYYDWFRHTVMYIEKKKITINDGKINTKNNGIITAFGINLVFNKNYFKDTLFSDTYITVNNGDLFKCTDKSGIEINDSMIEDTLYISTKFNYCTIMSGRFVDCTFNGCQIVDGDFDDNCIFNDYGI